MGKSLSQSDSQDFPSGPAVKNPDADAEATCLTPGPGSLHRERSLWAEDWGPRWTPRSAAREASGRGPRGQQGRKRINHFKTKEWDEAGQGTESDF